MTSTIATAEISINTTTSASHKKGNAVKNIPSLETRAAHIIDPTNNDTTAWNTTSDFGKFRKKFASEFAHKHQVKDGDSMVSTRLLRKIFTPKGFGGSHKDLLKNTLMVLQLRSYVAGLLLTDGSFVDRGNVRVSFCSTDLDLAYTVGAYIEWLTGEEVRFIVTEPYGNRKRSYSVRANAEGSKEVVIDILPFLSYFRLNQIRKTGWTAEGLIDETILFGFSNRLSHYEDETGMYLTGLEDDLPFIAGIMDGDGYILRTPGIESRDYDVVALISDFQKSWVEEIDRTKKSTKTGMDIRTKTFRSRLHVQERCEKMRDLAPYLGARKGIQAQRLILSGDEDGQFFKPFFDDINRRIIFGDFKITKDSDLII